MSVAPVFAPVTVLALVPSPETVPVPVEEPPNRPLIPVAFAAAVVVEPVVLLELPVVPVVLVVEVVLVLVPA